MVLSSRILRESNESDDSEVGEYDNPTALIEYMEISQSYGRERLRLFELCELRGKETCDTFLLERLLHKFGPNIQNVSGETPLAVALKKLPKDLNHQVFETILRCGGDGMSRCKKNRVLADVIFTFAGRRALSVYLPYHHNIEAILNVQQETALHILVSRREIALVKKILAARVNPNITDGNGKTPLHIAVAVGSPTLVECLLRHSADINAQCNDGWTPLHYACGKMNQSCTNLLLKYGCDVNIKDTRGIAPLYYTMKFPCGDEHILERLLDAGCKIKETAANYQPLHTLASESIFGKNAAKYAKLLIDRGIDVNERDSNNCTPLHIAARFGSEEIIDCLLRNGAHIDVFNNANENPLQVVLRWGSHSQTLQMLKSLALKEFLTGEVCFKNIREIISIQRYYIKYISMKSELAALAEHKDVVSFIDVYLADRSQLMKYARDERIVRHVKQLEPTAFPNYGHYIKNTFGEILERIDALAFGTEFLMDTFEGKLPLVCARKMAQYFTNQDLWKWRDMAQD